MNVDGTVKPRAYVDVSAAVCTDKDSTSEYTSNESLTSRNWSNKFHWGALCVIPVAGDNILIEPGITYSFDIT